MIYVSLTDFKTNKPVIFNIENFHSASQRDDYTIIVLTTKNEQIALHCIEKIENIFDNVVEVYGESYDK